MKTFSRATLVATSLALAAGLTPATTATASSSDAPAGRSAPRTLLDVRNLEQGAPPSVVWSERRSRATVVHGAGGGTTTVPDPLTDLAPMGSGYVVQTGGNRPTTTRWVGADGTAGRHEWRTGRGLAVSPMGRVVAFAGKRGRVWTIDQEGDRVFGFNPVPVTGTAHAVWVVGENCKEGEGDPGFGCSIAVNGPRRAYYTSSHGIVDRVPRVRQVTTGRGRWLGGIASLSDTGSCSVMMRSWRVKWRTCDNQLSDISPDDGHVLGTPAYADGFGPTTLDVLATADGSVVRSFTAARPGRPTTTYFDEVWEDAEHVLVVTHVSGRWAIVRLGLDGSMEYAVAPRAANRTSPFQLQAR